MKIPAHAEFFQSLASVKPRGWQSELGANSACENRRIRIPTGFGKTLGVLGAWLYNRALRGDKSWPARLVWTLPMRVLVEQTEAEVRAALLRVGRLWDRTADHGGKVGVHVLMGGSDAEAWHLHPEHEAVLIGTQDMLLSRVLNRGYGAARARWPMELGLLGHDCLWVFDEVQLMDVGLATSVQVQAFREQDSVRTLRPCRSWWMSATLQPRWLETPDTTALLKSLGATEIPKEERTDPLWKIKKPLERLEPMEKRDLASKVIEIHLAQKDNAGRITLVVVNVVERAREVEAELRKRQKELGGVDIRLVHSRFRPHERADWRQRFLSREACKGADRIIVATQVVEAGVDISATSLVTEVAPWPSLVQRFGRVARYGGTGNVYVVSLDEKRAPPYEWQELEAAWEALGLLEDVGPASLETFEENHADRLTALYPYDPAHLLLRHELDELFDTTPDLSGADIDISRFIRSGEERDLQVAWIEAPAKGMDPDATMKPGRQALCAVPFLKARDWLCGPETKTKRSPSLLKGKRAWVWDYLQGQWRWAKRIDLYPGQLVVVPADQGGYTVAQGWDPAASGPVPIVTAAAPTPEEIADEASDAENLSAYDWKTIAFHGLEVGRTVTAIADELGLDRKLTSLLELSGRWHDSGKVHPAFQGSISSSKRPARNDLAKAPSDAWPRGLLYRIKGPPPDHRPGFRHELASTLALFAVLQRFRPDHPALLGPWRMVLEACGTPVPQTEPVGKPGTLEAEVLALDAESFDLLAYLVCSHHGKVRTRWYAAPADQDYVARTRGSASRVEDIPIRGVRDGDVLPAFDLCDAKGKAHTLGVATLTLAPASAGLSPITGASWLDRVQGLLRRHGPFTLAFLEAVLRAADIRASKLKTPDPLLLKEVTQ